MDFSLCMVRWVVEEGKVWEGEGEGEGEGGGVGMGSTGGAKSGADGVLSVCFNVESESESDGVIPSESLMYTNSAL